MKNLTRMELDVLLHSASLNLNWDFIAFYMVQIGKIHSKFGYRLILTNKKAVTKISLPNSVLQLA